MAQHTIIVDDITGETAHETVTFGLDGVEYAIDLTDANAHKLREHLHRWIEVSRRADTGRPATVRTELQPSSDTLRRWARANGYTMSDRGRIPRPVLDAFTSAQSSW